MLGIYERIDMLSKERKVSQKDLSEYLGLATPHVFANWKQRDSMLRADVAVRIANFFGVTVEYLVTGETSNPLQQASNDMSIKYYALLRKYEGLKKTMQDVLDKN